MAQKQPKPAEQITLIIESKGYNPQALQAVYNYLLYGIQSSDWEKERYLADLAKMQWESEKVQRDIDTRFVIRELNRLNALPEPIFLFDLPDKILRPLAESRFDTIGKVLFGFLVPLDRLLNADIDRDDWRFASHYTREVLLHTIDPIGYNLIGARLIHHGYLQREYFLNECQPKK